MSETDSVNEPITKVPRPEATTGEVRAYLLHILTTKHDVAPDEAKEIAARWKLGRGWDLRNLSKRRYGETFGDDIGPFFIKTVDNDITDEKAAETDAKWAR